LWRAFAHSWALLTPGYGRNYLNRIRTTFLKRSDPFLIVNFWRIIYVCRANGIFNVTKAREIGTFVIFSRAATYGADLRDVGRKNSGEREGRESRGREWNAGGRASQWGQGNNEKRGNMEWRWKSRMKKSVSYTLETTKEERCLRHARAVTANPGLLNFVSFRRVTLNARKIRGTWIFVRHFWLLQEGRFN